MPASDSAFGVGVTLIVKLPRCASIGTSPVSGVSVRETVGLVPACTLTVAAPLWVSTPPASNARIVILRAVPAGIVMVPLATPSATTMLNTSGVEMSGAVTSTTTVATAVPTTFAVTARWA